MSSRTVTILINALDKASPVFNKFGINVGSMGPKVLAAGKIAAVGFAAVAAGAAAAAAAGAAVAVGLAKAGMHFAEVGGELNDMSGRTGIAVEALAELKHAAGMTGASIENVEGSVKKMQKTIADAANGSKPAAAALARIGLSIEQLRGLSPDQQFQKISERIASIQDPALKTAAAMSIFGKSGTQLLPMMQNLRGLREEARRLGIVLSKDQVEAADALGDAMDRAKAAISGVVLQIGAQVAPVMTKLADLFSGVLSQIAQAISVSGPAISEVVAIITDEIGALFSGFADVSVFDLATAAIGIFLDQVHNGIKGFKALQIAGTNAAIAITQQFQILAGVWDRYTGQNTLSMAVDATQKMKALQQKQLEQWKGMSGPSPSQRIAMALAERDRAKQQKQQPSQANTVVPNTIRPGTLPPGFTQFNGGGQPGAAGGTGKGTGGQSAGKGGASAPPGVPYGAWLQMQQMNASNQWMDNFHKSFNRPDPVQLQVWRTNQLIEQNRQKEWQQRVAKQTPLTDDDRVERRREREAHNRLIHQQVELARNHLAETQGVRKTLDDIKKNPVTVKQRA